MVLFIRIRLILTFTENVIFVYSEHLERISIIANHSSHPAMSLWGCSLKNETKEYLLCSTGFGNPFFVVSDISQGRGSVDSCWLR